MGNFSYSAHRPIRLYNFYMIAREKETQGIERGEPPPERASRLRQRQRLIDACISALHLHGPSHTTVEKVVAHVLRKTVSGQQGKRWRRDQHADRFWRPARGRTYLNRTLYSKTQASLPARNPGNPAPRERTGGPRKLVEEIGSVERISLRRSKAGVSDDPP